MSDYNITTNEKSLSETWKADLKEKDIEPYRQLQNEPDIAYMAFGYWSANKYNNEKMLNAIVCEFMGVTVSQVLEWKSTYEWEYRYRALFDAIYNQTKFELINDDIKAVKKVKAVANNLLEVAEALTVQLTMQGGNVAATSQNLSMIANVTKKAYDLMKESRKDHKLYVREEIEVTRPVEDKEVQENKTDMEQIPVVANLCFGLEELLQNNSIKVTQTKVELETKEEYEEEEEYVNYEPKKRGRPKKSDKPIVAEPLPPEMVEHLLPDKEKDIDEFVESLKFDEYKPYEPSTSADFDDDEIIF